MKQVKNMSQVELAAYIQDSLQQEGIRVVLSGGSAVSFYSRNKYVSKDLDLINTNFARRRDIKSVMEKIGFRERGVISSTKIQIILQNFLTARFL